MYRVASLLANLGWVDFDLCCSTLFLVLPGLMGNWQKWRSRWARWWNISNQVNPTQVRQDMGQPVYNDVYRDEIYSLQILLSRTQAEPGKRVKQEQEEISRNHVQRLNLISVVVLTLVA